MEKIIKQPYLIKGEVMHQRFFPKKNYFNYKSTYISVPISQINQLKKTLFSIDRFNIFSFNNKDYSKNHGHNIDSWLRDILQKNNINNIKEIILVTHPKIMGYLFNPVSFWLCFDDKNQLIAVLNQVTNTAKQQHNYLCFKDDYSPINNNDWLEAQKKFYVSPFMKITGNYKFKIIYKNDELKFIINYIVNGKLKLTTSLNCDFKKLNNKNLLKSFFTIPFATLKTIILIHYQAGKLFFKKIKYDKYPKPLKNNLTIGKSAK